MNNLWDHLPNAIQLDRIISHVNRYPKKWYGVSWPYRAGTWEAARSAIVNDRGKERAWESALWEAPRRAAPLVWHALLALIAYDDCGYMLDFTPEQIRLYAALIGSPATILIGPAVIIMHR